MSSNRKIALVIRDDDVNYFTEPWMLETIYREAWKQGFKITFAVIPFVETTDYPFIPETSQHPRRFFKISENHELIRFLREKATMGHVDIAQHGFSHTHANGKAEFQVDDFKSVHRKLRMGNRILSEAFERRITVFTAPHEKISRSTWRSLKLNRMCLCRRFTLGRLLTTAPLLGLKPLKVIKVAAQNPNPFRLISNTIIDLAEVPIIQWNVLLSSNDDPRRQLETAREMFCQHSMSDRTFVLLQHYWNYFYREKPDEVNKQLLSCFNSLLDFISSSEKVWKTTLSDLFETLRPYGRTSEHSEMHN